MCHEVMRCGGRKYVLTRLSFRHDFQAPGLKSITAQIPRQFFGLQPFQVKIYYSIQHFCIQKWN